MKTHLLACLGLLGFLAVVPMLTAQITFTVTGYSDGGGFGYAPATSYTFVFTTTSPGSSNPSDSFGSIDGSIWRETTINDAALWSNLSGDVQASYVHPTIPPANTTFDAAKIRAYKNLANTRLDLFAGTADHSSPSNIGVKTLDGTSIGEIDLSAADGNLPSFSQPASWVNLNSYFNTYTGTYTPSGSSFLTLKDATAGHSTLLYFNVTSVQISPAAVPEPATCATLLGLGALGLAIVRRRLNRA